MLMEIESKVYTDEDVEVSGDALFPIPNLKKKIIQTLYKPSAQGFSRTSKMFQKEKLH